MKSITKDKLMKVLSEKFPKMWMKDGAEFDADYKNSIWTGEGSMYHDEDLNIDIPIFDHYGSNYHYTLGVLDVLVEVLNEYGLYAEAYDGGTYFIFVN